MSSSRRSDGTVTCPYCGSVVEVQLDIGGAEHQSYVEDCEVCCRPWRLMVEWDELGEPQVDARTEGE